jgi:hypothetical protein
MSRGEEGTMPGRVHRRFTSIRPVQMQYARSPPSMSVGFQYQANPTSSRHITIM